MTERKTPWQSVTIRETKLGGTELEFHSWPQRRDVTDRFTPGQQRILDAIDTHGYVMCHTDWRTGRRHVTTGRGESFDARTFDSLVKRGVIGVDTAEPQFPTLGVKYARKPEV